jgi:maltokinase
MLLVERVTEIVAQSYGTDAALLAELRAAWPPAEPPPGDAASGYRRIDLAPLEPAGAVRLTERFGVALAAEPGATFACVPIVRDGDGGGKRWRAAVPGDGLSALVAGVPLASERPVGVDQTHDSVVVGERAIVKWFRRVGPQPTRAAVLVAHLAAVGFDAIPTPLGSLAWRSPVGVELTLATGDAFLPDARDGWEWCVERAANDDRSAGTQLGELVRRLHEALATPSAVIPAPIASAGATDLDRWQRGALAMLDEAVEDTVDPELEGWTLAMRSAIEALPRGGDAAMQPVHGDLHVGQVLEWAGGLALIDFDGNPTLPDEANAVRQPRERDVAQMLSALDHVGRVVEERSGGDMSEWIGAVRAGFVETVGPVDERLLAAFEVEQECRELVYAARFLPRWRYAPMATLRARFGGE